MKQRLILFILTIALLSANKDLYAQQLIRTIAGAGAQAYDGDGGPAVRANIGNVYSVAVTDSGVVYSCDNYFNNVRRISTNGMISTYCGTGYPGYSGDDGPCTAARLAAPFSLFINPVNKNLYIGDAANYLIRMINSGDTISPYAGNHLSGYYNGDNIPALSAKLGVAGVSFDAAGNLFIADGNTRVRKVTASTGLISTVAGSGAVGFGGNGGAATAASFDGISGVCVDNAGNIYIADKTNQQIRKVNATTGIVTAFAGTGSQGFSGDGGQATAAKLNNPNAVRLDPQGNLVIVDQDNCRIRRVDMSTGIIRTIAGSGTNGFSGDGGAATAARISFPFDVAWDRYGNMFIADKGQASTTYGHRVREVFNIDTLHITANPGDTICGYSHVTFTAHEGLAKHYLSFYKWKLNGVAVGGNSPTYFTDSIRNGDVITVSLYDTSNGGFTIAVSDTIRMVVRPILVPSVLLSTSSDTLCAGQPVTITAVGLNGGTAPAYHWYKFGTLVGTGSSYTYIPTVGDIITCVIVSNATCAIPDSASNSRAIVVNTSYPPSVRLENTDNDTVVRVAYLGEFVTLASELTYEGTHPRFQWYKNNRKITGATNHVYTTDEQYFTDTFYCVMYSNAPCVVPDHDTSNKVILSTAHLVGVHGPMYTSANATVQPNPNNGSFTVTGLGGINTELAITITDMLGKELYSVQLPAAAKIDIQPGEQLPEGMYLLHIRYEGGSRTMRFVVQN